MKTKEHKNQTKRWSAEVTENSDALVLEENIFESKSSKKLQSH